MGRNISIYLNDEMIELIASTGKPTNRVVQAALKKYLSENRKRSFQTVRECAQTLGRSNRFKDILSDWANERGQNRL